MQEQLLQQIVEQNQQIILWLELIAWTTGAAAGFLLCILFVRAAIAKNLFSA